MHINFKIKDRIEFSIKLLSTDDRKMRLRFLRIENQSIFVIIMLLKRRNITQSIQSMNDE